MTHWRLDIIVESDVGKNVLVYIYFDTSDWNVLMGVYFFGSEFMKKGTSSLPNNIAKHFANPK